ncbi:hypothetical protein TNCV_2229601 [Trichonephila clavipes]|nr:hypothetical protein TNCV_2229601 [Trichonephila clavipes]
MGTAGGFDEEYCGQMMVVSQSSGSFTSTAADPDCFGRNRFHFDSNAGVHDASFNHGRTARARSSNFPVSSNI